MYGGLFFVKNISVLVISSLPFLFSYFTVANSRHKLLFQLETMVTEKKRKEKNQNKQTEKKTSKKVMMPSLTPISYFAWIEMKIILKECLRLFLHLLKVLYCKIYN